MGNTCATDVVRNCLYDSKSRVDEKVRSVQALGRLAVHGDATIMNIILECLDDENGILVVAALHVLIPLLEKLDATTTASVVSRVCLKCRAWKARRVAIQTLTALPENGGETGVDALRQCLSTDVNSKVRRAAKNAL